MTEPDTRKRNPKVQMAWGLLAPYIASEDPPDLSNEDQAEILMAGALPQVWGILLELEQRIEELEGERDGYKAEIEAVAEVMYQYTLGRLAQQEEK